MREMLRSVEEVLNGTRVILRMDLDLPIDKGEILDRSRLEKSLDTIELLIKKDCRILIIGHRGRPEGRETSLSLKIVYLELMEMLNMGGRREIESVFIDDITKTDEIDVALGENRIVFAENLRFWKGEEENNSNFLNGARSVCQFFVNDAFAVAHRKHASIMLFKLMPAFYGLSFISEVKMIEKSLERRSGKRVVVLGGAKKDKMKYWEEIEEKVDWILLGGKLPSQLEESEREKMAASGKVIVAKLREDGLDIDDKSIERFKEILKEAGTIIWAGSMGYFEGEDSKKGSEEIAREIAMNKGYKIIAGGDTGAVIENLGLKERIDYVCSGGGVMLEYLAKGKLVSWG